MMMKSKFKWLLLGIALIILAGGIGYQLGISKEPAYKVSFYARIDSLSENQVLVNGIPENDINHRGAFVLLIDDETIILDSGMSPINLEDLKAGTEIRVTYDGIVLESYPAMINGVIRIEVIQE